jgi:hypothetical protein
MELETVSVPKSRPGGGSLLASGLLVLYSRVAESSELVSVEQGAELAQRLI